MKFVGIGAVSLHEPKEDHVLGPNFAARNVQILCRVAAWHGTLGGLTAIRVNKSPRTRFGRLPRLNLLQRGAGDIKGDIQKCLRAGRVRVHNRNRLNCERLPRLRTFLRLPRIVKNVRVRLIEMIQLRGIWKDHVIVRHIRLRLFV